MNGLKVMKKDCEQNDWVCLLKWLNKMQNEERGQSLKNVIELKDQTIRGNLFVLYICSATFNLKNSIA